MKSILVTGATGFIGNHVIIRLLNEEYKRDYKIIATSVNEEKARHATWYQQVKYISFNLGNFDEQANYYEYFEKPDIMIHLAWEGLPNYKSLFHFEKNLPNHYAFLKNMIANGLTDLSVTGTCFEYGMQQGCLNEEMPSLPANPYALAKDTLRKFLQELQKIHPYLLKWIRLFYMYGAGQNPSSLFSQLDQALTKGDKVFNMSGGEQIRDYLPVEKVAEYIAAISTQQKVNDIINCGSGIPVTIKQLVEKYLQGKNKVISLNLGYYPYADYEPMQFWADNKKLKTIIEVFD